MLLLELSDHALVTHSMSWRQRWWPTKTAMMVSVNTPQISWRLRDLLDSIRDSTPTSSELWCSMQPRWPATTQSKWFSLLTSPLKVYFSSSAPLSPQDSSWPVLCLHSISAGLFWWTKTLLKKNNSTVSLDVWSTLLRQKASVDFTRDSSQFGQDSPQPLASNLSPSSNLRDFLSLLLHEELRSIFPKINSFL